MKNFTYYRPTTVEQAVSLLGKEWGKAEMLAGGTDLLDLQKEYVARPDAVVSLGSLGSLGGIHVGEKQPPVITIGAGTKLSEIAADATLKQYCSALTTAAGEVGGPQIRNMGTLGGNLCQRNRCWYFRDEKVVCLLKGSDKCYALDGENRYHAVFTKGHKCVIVNPSTLAPALIALGATAEIQGPAGKKRTVKLADFFQAPASATEREHVLAPNEILLSVKIEAQAGGKSASYEVRQKQSYDWPLVQAAVAFTLKGDQVSGVKIVLGHVAPTPVVASDAASKIEGKAITEETAQAAGEAAALGANPLSQNAYKVKLIAVAVKRALLTAAGAKKYWEV